VAMPPGVEPMSLLELMRLDKKNTADVLRMILWRGIGRVEIVDAVGEAVVLSTLEHAGQQGGGN